MADFDWLTEDEDAVPAETGEAGLQKKRPSWLYPLLMLLIIAMSAAAIYSLIVRRAEATEDEIKADIQRTHELLLEAAEAKDVELFTTFLSGANDAWLNAQKEAVRRGRFNESSWLGIYLDKDRPYRLDEITLSPNFEEAIVTYTRWYEVQEQAGVSVPLQHTAIYRRGEGQWLFSPPTAGFWGRPKTFRDGNLTISYPQHDEDYVLRIADNIVAGMPEICNAQVSRNCPDGWHLRIELTDDPDTVINPTTIDGPISSLNLALPSPSLIGLPLDGVGYNFLYRSYHLVLRRRLTSVVQRYITEQPDLVPPVLEITLIDEPTVEAPDNTNNVAEEAPDITNNLPDLDLTITCVSANNNWNVLQYSLQTGNWQSIFQTNFSSNEWGTVIALEGGQDFAIQKFQEDEEIEAQLLLVQDGETILINEETVDFRPDLQAPYFPRKLDPTGRFLEIGASKDFGDGWYLLDRDSCEETTGCEMQAVLNRPIWSPDGEQMLLEESSLNNPNFRLLYRADNFGQNLVEVGMASTPFWLDEQTYGYTRLNEDEEMELLLANAQDDSARLWLETSTLMSLVPEERIWNQLLIWNVWVNPADPQTMLVMTTPTGQQNSGPYDYFLVQGDPYGEEPPQIEWLFSNDFPAVGILPFSPDGRFILATTRGFPAYFLDLETRSPLEVDQDFGFIVDWSPDGQFYVQWSDDALTLTSPAEGYQAQIFYDFSACFGLQWIEN